MPKNKKEDGFEDKNDKNHLAYKYKKGEKSLFSKRKKRFEKMLQKKKLLGIDDKIDRMDALYTPHLTTLDDPNQFKIQTSQEFINDAVLVEHSRKSMPLAFEKITTAQSLLLKENPKCIMKASQEIDRKNSFLIQNIYYENFSTQRKKEVARKYIYQLAKYGLAYWREYIKKTYRKKHIEDENGKTALKWVYDVFDVVAENINPKNVILDNNCISVKDVNRPANDACILEYLTKEEFDAKYPIDYFPNSEFVKENQTWMLEVDSNGENNDVGKTKIQVIDYENRFENLLETWANGVPIRSVPLPGDELSINGDKWVEDLDNYDGIGIGQIIEIYLPLVDDIVNCSLERLRQIVRPNEDWYDGIDLADESDDIPYGTGAVRKFNGPKGGIVYSQPPARTDAEIKEKIELMEEIDKATMIPQNLTGTDKAKTAYQSAQNREAALAKMVIPLASIKKTLEDAANLDLSLYQICYGQPEEVLMVKPGDLLFDEGIAIMQDAESKGLEDERAVVMETDEEGRPAVIARRKFRQMELPVEVQKRDDGKPTGHIVEADEKKFWELLPKDYVWKGRIEIIGESFLPVSKVLEDEQNKETIEYLMNLPITDEMGKPTLTDAQGAPYMIDKVRLAKDRCRMNKNFDPDRYVVPMTQQNQGQGGAPMAENGNPLESATNLSAANLTNNARPEVANLKV